jgi:hypothetical protein
MGQQQAHPPVSRHHTGTMRTASRRLAATRMARQCQQQAAQQQERRVGLKPRIRLGHTRRRQ